MRMNARVGVIRLESEGVHAGLVKTSGTPTVTEYKYARFGPADEEMTPAERRAEAIAQATGDMTSAEAWMLCVDSSWGVARAIEVPFKGRRVAAAVPFELEPHLAFPIEEVSVDYAAAGDSADGTRVIAVGLRRAVLDEQMEACAIAGIRIDGAGLDVLGLTSLSDTLAEAQSGPRAMLHVRDENAALVVTERGKLRELELLPLSRAEFTHRPDDAWRTVGNALRVLEPIVGAEAAITLHVYGLGDPSDSEYSLSGAADVVFHETLLPKQGGATEFEARDLLAGVALCGAGGPYAMNFVDATLAPAGAPQAVIRRGVLTAGLLVGLLATFLTFRYAEYRENTRATQAIGAEVWRIYSETFPDRPDTAARPPGDVGGFMSFDLMQKAAEEEEEALAVFSPDVFQRPTLLDVMNELSTRIPPKAVTLTNVKITTGRRIELTLYGEARNADMLNRMLEQLRRSTMFEIDERRLTRSSAGGRETFELVARY